MNLGAESKCGGLCLTSNSFVSVLPPLENSAVYCFPKPRSVSDRVRLFSRAGHGWGMRSKYCSGSSSKRSHGNGWSAN